MDYIREDQDTDKAIDELSAELKRAEAAAVETCKAVAQSLESAEDANGRQDTGG